MAAFLPPPPLPPAPPRARARPSSAAAAAASSLPTSASPRASSPLSSPLAVTVSLVRSSAGTARPHCALSCLSTSQCTPVRSSRCQPVRDRSAAPRSPQFIAVTMRLLPLPLGFDQGWIGRRSCGWWNISSSSLCSNGSTSTWRNMTGHRCVYALTCLCVSSVSLRPSGPPTLRLSLSLRLSVSLTPSRNMSD